MTKKKVVALVVVSLAVLMLAFEQLSTFLDRFAVEQQISYGGTNVPDSIYRSGFKSDLDDDGVLDFISAYGCVFLSAASSSAQPVTAECDLPAPDTHTELVFTRLWPQTEVYDLTGLQADEVAMFSRFPGQKYASKPVPAFDPNTKPYPEVYELYLESNTAQPTLVVERSNYEVQSFVITPQGKLESVKPSWVARLRALTSFSYLNDSSTLFLVLLISWFLSRIVLIGAALWLAGYLVRRGLGSMQKKSKKAKK